MKFRSHTFNIEANHLRGEKLAAVFMRFVVVFGAIVAMVSCSERKKMFRALESEETNIDFVNKLTPTDDLNILTYLYYYNGAGVAVADFNNDGLNDVYFTSNQQGDKLYLNRGALRFEDVTSQSGIENSGGWTTGVTYADINNDGLLDLYVCKVGKYKSISGVNLLYINQGPGDEGIPTFVESAHKYGLDVVAFSTQAAFFDYDLDGDLDMYLLCHSVNPNHSYGRGEMRSDLDSLSGDRIFENVDGQFIDVSATTGIHQGKIGYGLGLSIGDLNQDDYPDIYVGNDFFENDYLYQNNQDGTFTDLNVSTPSVLGHTTHYSMGNCFADLDNNGTNDILSLDMLPEDITTLKTSGVEDGYPIYFQYLQNGYSPQFMQNTLHLNSGNGIFHEVGFQFGIAATEWSWGVLAADYDLDGFKDLYITNGIVGATNDMDYINFISQDAVQKSIGSKQSGDALAFGSKIPEKKVINYAFRNSGRASFSDITKDWFDVGPSFSNGGAYADLDNDGDLDLVVNNINEQAFVLENTSRDNFNRSFLTVRFQGAPSNRFGVGARVEVFSDSLHLYGENFPVKSYLSSVPPELTFGLGSRRLVDSLRVVWPDRKTEKISAIEPNKIIILDYVNSKSPKTVAETKNNQSKYLENWDELFDFEHHEEPTLDFHRNPLVPFALSNEGPRMAVGDVNNDSLDDIFVTGGKAQTSRLMIQQSGGTYTSVQEDLFSASAQSEDVDALFFDADNDGDQDLIVVSGGNEYPNGDPLKPRLYLNNGGKFQFHKSGLSSTEINASRVGKIDMDNDGDWDIIVTSDASPREFGINAQQIILENDGTGGFRDVSVKVCPELNDIGLITDFVVVDIDHNGYEDIVAVGTWMPVTLLMNNGGSFSLTRVPATEGWWRSIAAGDFDKDGDIDLLTGNWGLNSRLKATEEQPVRLLRYDFDGNGTEETIITYFYNGQEIFLASMDELAKQMPFIRKKYTTYHAFANATVEDVLGVDKVRKALKRQSKIMASTYFENRGDGTFETHTLPPMAQQSTVNAIAVDDFNGDDFKDVLLVGNNYEISTQLGRLDASHGVLLLNDRQGFFTQHTRQAFNVEGPARDLAKAEMNGSTYYIVAINNGKPIFLRKENWK